MKNTKALILGLAICLAVCCAVMQLDARADEPSAVSATAEKYIIVANEWWTIETYYELTENPKPATWLSGTSGLTGYEYGGISYLAPEGMMVAVKESNIAAYASGEIADEDIVYIEYSDTNGEYVGTEVLVEFNTDGSVKSWVSSGNSVVGELTITKSGENYTVKIGDKTYFTDISANTKFTQKAYDAASVSCYYVSSATKKSVFVYNSAENFDLQTCFGNESRDVTTIGIFYDEFYNLSYEGGCDAYDWDGDGVIDLVMVNRPVTGKVTADSDGTSVSFGVLGDNHSYCGCGGWHSSMTVFRGTFPVSVAKNDIVFVYEDYRTGYYTIIKPEVISGILTSVDIAQGKAIIGGKTYNLYNAGDLPYVNGRAVTQYETDAQKALWEGNMNNTVSICTDSLDNIIWAALPTVHTHTWGAETTPEGMTCTETAIRIYTCSVCKATKTENVAEFEHSWEYVTSQGAITLYQCEICDETMLFEKAVTEISISALPNKTEYAIGEALDLTGGYILVKYNDFSEETIAITSAMVSGYDSASEGTKALTVTYEGLTASFVIVIRGTPVTVTISNATAYISDDTVELIFTLSGAENLKSLGVYDIEYDESKFSFISGVWTLPGEPLINSPYEQGDVNMAVAAYDGEQDCNTAIFKLTLGVLDTATEGKSSVTCGFTAEGVSGTVQATVVAGEINLRNALRGDVNGDGKVNSADAIYLLRHILLPSRFPINEEIADSRIDYNGDGKVNSADAIYLLRHSLLPSRFPLA